MLFRALLFSSQLKSSAYDEEFVAKVSKTNVPGKELWSTMSSGKVTIKAKILGNQ
jgi:hypothetical protein